MTCPKCGVDTSTLDIQFMEANKVSTKRLESYCRACIREGVATARADGVCRCGEFEGEHQHQPPAPRDTQGTTTEGGTPAGRSEDATSPGASAGGRRQHPPPARVTP